MASKRERKRVRSSVDELPDKARARLDAMLADTANTYAEIVEALTEDGFELSRSAVGRYAMRHNGAARRLKEAKEQTAALINIIKDNQDIEATELATAIFVDGLTRRIATADEEFDELPLDKAGRLLVQMQRTSVYKERFRKERLATIRSVEANIMSRLRKELEGNPDLLGDIQAYVREAAAEEERRDDA